MLTSSFFSPQSIAIVGASATSSKLGHIVLKNLIDDGFDGKLYPINPKGGEILGLETLSTLGELPLSPDLVVVAVPAKFCVEVMHDIITSGSKNVVMFTAGFKESGKEGEAVEQEIISLANSHDISLLGPNCLGFVSPQGKVNATFSAASMKEGSLRLVSQSGALVSAFFDRSGWSGVGVDACITVGNKAVLSENDFLDYWNGEEKPGPIGMYLESITDKQGFRDVCTQASLQAPVFLLKPGKSQAAQKAMQSHTGSIAGNDKLLTALCNQSGIIRCDAIEDFLDMCMITSRNEAPQGNRVALITNAGGPGVISTDLLEEYGLIAATFSDDVQEKLQAVLPSAASVKDPVDVLGDALADRYEHALEIVLQDTQDVDAVLVLLTPQLMTEVTKTAQCVTKLSQKYNLPIVCSFIGHNHVAQGIDVLLEQQVPTFFYPQRAIKALANHYSWTKRKNQYVPHQNETHTKKHSVPSGYIQESFSENLFTEGGIAIPEACSLKSIHDGEQFIDNVSYPIVMKLGGVAHKTEYKGVITSIDSKEKYLKAWEHFQEVLEETGPSVSLRAQKQIEGGIECILGWRNDESFGDVLIFGAGGTMTELYHDHQIRLLPLNENEILSMLQHSSVRPLLEGWRGEQKVNISHLLKTIKDFINLCSTYSLESCEINPLIVTSEKTYAVDVKMIGEETLD